MKYPSGSNFTSDSYATKVALTEARRDIDLLREDLEHGLRVHENGYLVLFREHERDLVRLRWTVRYLLLTNLVLLIAVALLVART